MSRFVLVSFAFLGWGFYELSGGADFSPPERPERTAAKEDAAAKSSRGSAAEVTAASLVTRPVLQLAPEPEDQLVLQPISQALPQTAASQPPAANPELRAEVALNRIESAGGLIGTGLGGFDNGLSTGGLEIASIEDGLASISVAAALPGPAAEAEPAAAPEPETYMDIRAIRGSRVNMRSGPGTSHPVIAQLLAGDEVIVIGDSGTGWLNLREAGGNRIGWIAASLVSKKRP